MNRVALDLGFIQVYWYSIAIFLGIAVASIVILTETKKQKINQDFMINLIFYGVIFGLLGARLYYVLFNLDYYTKYPIEILEIWNGGMAIHGAIIFGLATIYLYCRKYKAKFLKILDIVVVGFIIGQAIGRWGNFFNKEAHGAATTYAKLKDMPERKHFFILLSFYHHFTFLKVMRVISGVAPMRIGIVPPRPIFT